MKRKATRLSPVSVLLAMFLLPSLGFGAASDCSYPVERCPDRSAPAGARWTTAAEVVRTDPSSPEVAVAAVLAEEQFWCIFNTKNYACLAELQDHLLSTIESANDSKLSAKTAAARSNIERSISLLHGRLGFLYTWLATEMTAVESYSPAEVEMVLNGCAETKLPSEYKRKNDSCTTNTKYHFDLAAAANKKHGKAGENPEWWEAVPMVPAVVAGFHSGQHGPDEGNDDLLAYSVTKYPWFNISTPVIGTFLTRRKVSFLPVHINQMWRIMAMCARLPVGTRENGVSLTAGADYFRVIERYGNSPYITSAPVYRSDITTIWNGETPSGHSINEVCGTNDINNGDTNVPHAYPNNLSLLGDMVYYNCYQAEQGTLGKDSKLECGTTWRGDVLELYEMANESLEDAPWLYARTLTDRIGAIEAAAGDKSKADAMMIAFITAYNDGTSSIEGTAYGEGAKAYVVQNPPCMICHQK